MLLDTHVVLWLISDDARLGSRSRARLEAATERLVSAASFWEIAIKSELGKLTVPADLPARLAAAGLSTLAIGPEHAWAIRGVSGLAHRDPFDRMLLAQAHHEGVPVLTADAAILGADLHPSVERLDARD